MTILALLEAVGRLFNVLQIRRTVDFAYSRGYRGLEHSLDATFWSC